MLASMAEASPDPGSPPTLRMTPRADPASESKTASLLMMEALADDALP